MPLALFYKIYLSEVHWDMPHSLCICKDSSSVIIEQLRFLISSGTEYNLTKLNTLDSDFIY